MFWIAASKVAKGGVDIMSIESVGGQTLDEAYYFALGSVYDGYTLMIQALGVFCASVLIWLGLRKD
jgi:threonine/homoserine/homoserine lactone efflux protein